MAQAALIEFASKRMEYIQLMESCGVLRGSAQHSRLIADAQKALESAVRSAKAISPEQVVAMKELCEGKLSEEHVNSLVRCMGSKTNQNDDSVAKQSNLYLDMYLTERL